MIARKILLTLQRLEPVGLKDWLTDTQFQDGEGTKRYANGNLSACPDATNNSATKT